MLNKKQIKEIEELTGLNGHYATDKTIIFGVYKESYHKKFECLKIWVNEDMTIGIKAIDDDYPDIFPIKWLAPLAKILEEK